MAIKAFLFDFDGTLVDSMPTWMGKIREIMKRRNIPCTQELLRFLTPKGDQLAMEYLIKTYGWKESPSDLVAEMDAYALPKYAKEVMAKKGVLDYLTYLKQQEIRLGVLTASPHRMMQPCLQNNGLFDFFEVLWTSEEDFGLSKANPEIYRLAADRLKIEPAELAFADDNLLADTAAKKAGIYTIGVFDASSAHDEEAIRAVVDTYVYSFTELIS